jgi:hypothetical protein
VHVLGVCDPSGRGLLVLHKSLYMPLVTRYTEVPPFQAPTTVKDVVAGSRQAPPPAQTVVADRRLATAAGGSFYWFWHDCYILVNS